MLHYNWMWFLSIIKYIRNHEISKMFNLILIYTILLAPTWQVIVRQSVDKAEFQESSVEKILNLLFNHCESEEEGVRNVVAECLGKIALIEPVKLVPALKVSKFSFGILYMGLFFTSFILDDCVCMFWNFYR